MSSGIEISSLSYSFLEHRALEAVSASISPGEITALVGPNGAGKTTLLRCIAGLDLPHQGSVTIAGFDTRSQPREVFRRIGYLSDSFGLYDSLTVKDCLIHAAGIRSLHGDHASKEISRVIEQLSLERLLTKRTAVLSRGERQRTGIAQAIIHSPAVLLLDEPASGLDPEARAQLATLLKRLKAGGMTVLVSSHILSELSEYSDYMLTLSHGRCLGNIALGAHPEGISARLRIEVLAEAERAELLLRSHAQISQLHCSANTFECLFSGSPEQQAALLRQLIESRIAVTSCAATRTSMEQVYLEQVRSERETPR